MRLRALAAILSMFLVLPAMPLPPEITGSPPVIEVSVPPDDLIVWIGTAGDAYHVVSCAELPTPRVPIPLSEAREAFRPCPVCVPPT